MSKIKVLIVDDHAILRMGLASLLSAKEGIEVIGDAEDGKSAIRLAKKLKPDVVIMDLMMPEMDGVEATKRLLEEMPEIKVLILTTFGASDGIANALAAGAKGAVMKSVAFADLVEAIRTVANGGEYVSDELKRILASDPPIPTLSPRQLEILESMARGLSNAEIGRQLGITADMVREHSVELFAKLRAANRAEAVAIAMRKHLLKI